MKKNPITELVANLIVLIVAVAVISLLCMFSWNFGATYLLPNLNEVGYLNALAIVTAIAVVHILVNFYINKIFIIKQRKQALSDNYYIINMLDIVSNKLDELLKDKN